MSSRKLSGAGRITAPVPGTQPSMPAHIVSSIRISMITTIMMVVIMNSISFIIVITVYLITMFTHTLLSV